MAANPSEVPSSAPQAPAAPAPQAAPVVAAVPSTPPAAAPEAAAAPVAEWFLADGVKGTGPAPEWYVGAKYKTLADQAKAYPEALKKIGELEAKQPKAAPESYTLPSLETFGGDVAWNAEDPMLKAAFDVAKQHGVSQETFNDLALKVMMPIIRNYEMVDIAQEKAKIGDRADERLTAIQQWSKSNLAPEQDQAVNAVLTKWSQPHEVFKALEAVMQAHKQPSMRPNDDAAAASTRSVQELNAKYYAKSSIKGYAYVKDEPGNAEKYRAELAAIVGTGDHIEVVGRRA